MCKSRCVRCLIRDWKAGPGAARKLLSLRKSVQKGLAILQGALSDASPAAEMTLGVLSLRKAVQKGLATLGIAHSGVPPAAEMNFKLPSLRNSDRKGLEISGGAQSIVVTIKKIPKVRWTDRESLSVVQVSAPLVAETMATMMWRRQSLVNGETR